jgi:hypothetical protein
MFQKLEVSSFCASAKSFGPPSQPQEPLAPNVKADYDLVNQIGTRKAWEIFPNTYKTRSYAELAAAPLAKIDGSRAGRQGRDV